jgi:hypothetical protein
MFEHFPIFAGIYLIISGLSGYFTLLATGPNLRRVQKEYGPVLFTTGFILASLAWPVTLALAISEILKGE